MPPQSHDGPTTEDWPGETPANNTTHGRGINRRTRVRDRGMNTGVRVMDDGRLDIKFHEHKPWVAKIIQHLQRQPEPLDKDRQPSVCPHEGDSPCTLKLNIVIQVVGSRGDVQPFIALGKVLKSHGHRVRLATHLAFRESIENDGLEFFNIGGDPAELMAFMVRNPGLMPHMSTIRSGAIRRRRREMKTIFSGCWRSCFETGDGTGMHRIAEDPWNETADYRSMPFVADAIIANPPSFAHLSCAEKLGIPLNMMFTMPWSATQAFPHPLATIRTKNTKPSAANFASYAVVEVIMWEGLGDLINNFRKRELGLDPLDAIRAPSIAHRLRIPYTYLWSPALLPKPGDWGDNVDVAGFAFLDSASDYTPPDEIASFLKAGPPPIYVGFGSIVVDNPGSLTKIVFAAIRETGQRAIVSKGWGNLGADEHDIPDNILMIGKCPHDWLFPRVSCVIHHGGAGTTAAGLVLGRPTVVIPFFGDQPFWGSIVARAGAGPVPVPYKQLTVEKLTAAINKALEPETLEKAKEIGEEMRTEQGVRNAAASFYNHLDSKSLRCSICPHLPAVWWVRHSHIKLSTFAAAVLVETGLVESRNVVLYRSREYDTNRDPRGPLTAGAEVLYGIISGFVSGIADVPGGMAGIFSTTHEGRLHRRHDWKKSRSPEYLKERSSVRRRHRTMSSLDSGVGHDVVNHASPEPRSEHDTDTDTDTTPDEPSSATSNNPDSRSMESDEAYHSADESIPNSSNSNSNNDNTTTTTTTPTQGETTARESSPRSSTISASTDTLTMDADSLGADLDLERTVTRLRTREMSNTKEFLAETSYHSSQAAKHVLNWIIMLPTDITLTLSRGFHNAPKLYNDSLVEDTPKVLGVRSGFRAAGTELTHGFYNGVTGLVTQPMIGMEKSGGAGLLKGVGKGVGGVFLKPMAGLWGLAGYPLDGIHKNLRNSLAKSKTRDIITSRMRQGIEEMCAATTQQRSAVIQRWRELQGG
ncbi:UDP-glucose,sterol transferase [Aspergillus heteromorphus CBS 117.55]|uniref:UDP-glucose,sterol transferase n=1 Tax=Aspergillus heteromorphus CBS 117.55 TaxID=1448321 RepID=A0A317WSV0_9EURO|nr:UDP-glucose,sterol transferase [Aspergillus heteromorphus CBS 117.55]PWY89175.1 UDP-glucose,sterol transferase [Aspergillus heteromorphus CBS 117.55]